MRRNWNALPGSWVSRTLFASLLFLVASGLQAQDTVRVTGADTVAYEPDWRVGHSPGKAALYSALLPGAGQVYNRKWWKVPIAYAGLGISYYFIRENTREYQRYKTAYLATIDGDPNTVDEFDGQFTSAGLLNATEQYRRWMEWSYIAFGLVYILNVMDAAVDAYFVRFDVSPDLSLRLAPSLSLAAQGALGLSLGVNL